MDYSMIPVGASVGLHKHRDDEEEFYLILRGRGRFHCNGEEVDVGEGDLLRNPPGGTHSLVNTGAEELVMFVFEVRVPQ
jgi:mannose-6-phosphate isomerase-like protein (cupin superfamily)